METNYKISIPEPCHKDWDKMIPNKEGRFCLSCSKTVVDFTSMTPENIKHFFVQNQNNKVCGRFKDSQLDTISIQIPRRVLYTQTSYHKMFLLALFAVMGTTLFSCQNKDGKKQKIDTVKVVADTSTTEPIVVGKTKIDKNNSNRKVPPPPKVDQVKFVKPKEKNNSYVSQGEVSITGAVNQTNAEFPGGIDQFYTFFTKEFKKPEGINTKNLKIKISFAVEKNGSMTYIQSDSEIDKSLENEIIRVFNLAPKWLPAESNGKKTRMLYSLPIGF